jgi:hypothetical protein
MTAREAAEMLRKLVACSTTHGPVLHIMSREEKQQLGEATRDGNGNVGTGRGYKRRKWECRYGVEQQSSSRIRLDQREHGQVRQQALAGGRGTTGEV